MKCIAIIPARKGSKGLKNKNVLNLMGKPMIAYTIEAALETNLFSDIVVSTDSYEYGEIAKSYGASVEIRNDFLSKDTTSTFAVVEAVLEKYGETDCFVLLQPTSPLRDSYHIKDALSKFNENKKNFDYLVSVCESDLASELVKPIDENNSLSYFDIDFSNYRRQEKKDFSPNGAIFIAKTQPYLKQKHFFGNKSFAFVMDKMSSIDIDDYYDFVVAINFLNIKHKNEIHKQNLKIKIAEKKSSMGTSGKVLLIGDSHIERWKTKQRNYTNAGIADITIEEYYKQFVDYICEIPNKIVICLGTNDVKYGIKNNISIEYYKKLINLLLVRNCKAKIYILDIPHVNYRIDRDNEKIHALNALLHAELDCVENVTLELLDNSYGNLKFEFTDDGLHLNENGYDKLTDIIKPVLKSR